MSFKVLRMLELVDFIVLIQVQFSTGVVFYVIAKSKNLGQGFSY